MASSEYLGAVTEFFEGQGWDTVTTKVSDGVYLVEGRQSETDAPSQMLTMVVDDPVTRVTTDHLEFLLKAGKQKNADTVTFATSVDISPRIRKEITNHNIKFLEKEKISRGSNRGFRDETDASSMPGSDNSSQSEADDDTQAFLTRRRLVATGTVVIGGALWTIGGSIIPDGYDIDFVSLEDNTGAGSDGSPTGNGGSSNTENGGMMFRNNPAKTGYSPDEVGPTQNITQEWVFETGGKVRTTPAITDGTVYVGSYDENLYALDAGDGTEQWSFETGGQLTSSPAVVGDTVYIGCYDNNVYAVDAETGEQQWSIRTDGTVKSSPTVVDNTLYIGSNDSRIYALDTATGEQQWSYLTDRRVESSPAVIDGTVYVGSYDENLYALDAGDGTEQWSFETGGLVDSSPAVVDDSVYVASSDADYVYALDAETGEQQWSFEIGRMGESSPAVVDGTIYIGSSRHVYALDAVTGDQRWSFRTGSFVDSSPIVADGIVYIGSENRRTQQGLGESNVHALDATTGNELWSFEADDTVESSVVPVDGTVYFGSWDSNVYALT